MQAQPPLSQQPGPPLHPKASGLIRANPQVSFGANPQVSFGANPQVSFAANPRALADPSSLPSPPRHCITYTMTVRPTTGAFTPPPSPFPCRHLLAPVCPHRPQTKDVSGRARPFDYLSLYGLTSPCCTTDGPGFEAVTVAELRVSLRLRSSVVRGTLPVAVSAIALVRPPLRCLRLCALSFCGLYFLLGWRSRLRRLGKAPEPSVL